MSWLSDIISGDFIRNLGREWDTFIKNPETQKIIVIAIAATFAFFGGAAFAAFLGFSGGMGAIAGASAGAVIGAAIGGVGYTSLGLGTSSEGMLAGGIAGAIAGGVGGWFSNSFGFSFQGEYSNVANRALDSVERTIDSWNPFYKSSGGGTFTNPMTNETIKYGASQGFHFSPYARAFLVSTGKYIMVAAPMVFMGQCITSTCKTPTYRNNF